MAALSEDERIAQADSIVRPAVRPIRGIEPSVESDKAMRRADQLPARPELSKLAVGVVADVLIKVLNGRIKVQNAAQAKGLVETCYGIVRLEAGEATTITQMNQGEILESIKMLRDKATREAKVTPPKVV